MAPLILGTHPDAVTVRLVQGDGATLDPADRRPTPPRFSGRDRGGQGKAQR